MKVLVTGSTAQQIGNGTMLKYGPVIDLLVQAMRDAGVEVDHRRVLPEEDISEYDVLLAGMSPLNALSCYYVIGNLDAIRRAKESGVGLLFYVDDWQTHLLPTSIKTIVKKPERITKPLMPTGRPKNWEWAMYEDESGNHPNLDKLMTVINALNERPWPPTLLPRFNWGMDEPLKIIEKHIPSSNMIHVDPSSYVDQYPLERPSDDLRWAAWVFGILSDQRGWLNSLELNWKVLHAGGKASKAPQRIKEPQLVQQYANAWGVLSVPYKHAGSGWWRNRFVYAAYAESILCSFNGEWGQLGEPYQVTPHQVEGLTIPQLRELADAQRVELTKWQTTKEELQEQMLSVLREAKAQVS